MQHLAHRAFAKQGASGGNGGAHDAMWSSGGLPSAGAPGVGGSGLVLTQRQLDLQRQPAPPPTQPPPQLLLREAAAVRVAAAAPPRDDPGRMVLQKLPSESQVGKCFRIASSDELSGWRLLALHQRVSSVCTQAL